MGTNKAADFGLHSGNLLDVSMMDNTYMTPGIMPSTLLF